MKNPYNYSFSLAFIIFFTVSCKKEKEKTPEESPSTAFATPTKFDANIQSFCNFRIQNGTIDQGSLSYQASLFTTSRNIDSIGFIFPDANVVEVSLNDTNKFSRSQFGSYDYIVLPPRSKELINSSKSWRITGNKSFPSIFFTENYFIPRYQHYDVLPDTIYASKDNIIRLGNITESDKVAVIFSTNTNVIPFIKTLSVADKELKLIPKDFEYYKYEVDKTCKCSIEITLSKVIYRSVRGKIIRFDLVSSYLINSILKVD